MRSSTFKRNLGIGERITDPKSQSTQYTVFRNVSPWQNTAHIRVLTLIPLLVNCVFVY